MTDAVIISGALSARTIKWGEDRMGVVVKRIFETEEKAKGCLREQGWTDEDMYWLVFEKI